MVQKLSQSQVIQSLQGRISREQRKLMNPRGLGRGRRAQSSAQIRRDKKLLNVLVKQQASRKKAAQVKAKSKARPIIVPKLTVKKVIVPKESTFPLLISAKKPTITTRSKIQTTQTSIIQTPTPKKNGGFSFGSIGDSIGIIAVILFILLLVLKK